MSNKNSNKQNQRKKRVVHSVDEYDITEKINNEKITDEQKSVRYDFATRLNALLEEKEIDQVVFANNIGVSVGALSNYRNGSREPNITILKQIADKLNVSTDYLLGIIECPDSNYKDINEITGLSQKAIEQLYKFQHDYFVFDDIDIDITKKRKISEFYRSHLDILNYMIVNNGFLFLMLDNIDKYQKQYEELSKYEKIEKNKDILIENEKKEKLEFYKFKAQQNFLSYLEDYAKEKNTNTTNVVIYAKYHNHNTTEKSIEEQIDLCRKYAKENKLTVIAEYMDRSNSREQFETMIKDSSSKNFKGVLVSSLDRFARTRYDNARYKYELKKNGVKVISATENLSDDASSILIESVLEGMAEYYSLELDKKIKRQMKA